MKVHQLILVLLCLLLAGCQGLPLASGTTSPGSTAAPSESPTPTTGAAPSPTSAETPPPLVTPSGTVTLRLWMPPQFDPASETPAGDLLRARLDAFTTQNPNVRLEVRLKALEGPGGLLDALAAASAAAPLALPDLIALPRPLLESAALKGLLYPYGSLTTSLEEDTWYEYARQLAYLQNSTFGLPFAGDALLLVYRPVIVEQPPQDWDTAVAISGTLTFAAADPQAFFTLSLYQASGGAVQDEQGRPYLDEDILNQVLTFYQQAEQVGVMPYWLTQYETYDQVWDAYAQSQSPMVVAWASRFLNEAEGLPVGAAGALIPTPEGKAYSLATGWVWALASPQPERQAMSAQLAEFLIADEFLGEWAVAAGYLPVRTGGLSAWTDASLRSLLRQVALAAQLYPSADVSSSLGPALERATVQVLKQQSDPLSAAKSAAESLKSP